MRTNQGQHLLSTMAILLLTTLGIGSAVERGSAKQAAKEKLFAQDLVERTQAMHPEATEIGISVRSSRGCSSIASTDPGDIGEPCEKDDLTPMRTGAPFAEKEKDGFDVSLPLHDRAGKVVGSVGIEFKASPGQTQGMVVSHAKKIASEMEAQIPSKAGLFQHVK